MSQVHPLARTTPRTRAEIKASPDSITALSYRYNIGLAAARKWKGREDVDDRSHRPHKLSTMLTPGQDALVVELRRTLLLSLDDLVAITHEFINPAASRSGLGRCLRRHGVANLKSLQPEVEGEAAPKKIQKVLADNGSHFTDRFTGQEKRATGKHAFDLACAALGIEHRLSPPRYPQTNGMVERFNGRVSDLVKQTRIASAAELETTLEHHLKIYNHHIPQRALNYQISVQALRK